jgi:hypothetical protein
MRTPVLRLPSKCEWFRAGFQELFFQIVHRTNTTGDQSGPCTQKKWLLLLDNGRDTMVLKHGVVLTILLISALIMAGCTGSPSAPVPGTPAPAETAAPVVPYAAWTTETPATGHP